eukprot:scaffold1651_cov317-Pinguiococcus_pyrenoidosus.AAC.21
MDEQYLGAQALRGELQSFFAAAADGDVDTLRAYLEAHSSDAASEVLSDTKDAHGRCALHFACNHGGEDAVEFLLETCPQLWEAVDEDGNTPLHLAVTGRQRAVVKMLLEAEADVNRTDKSGVTPLHHAAGLGSVKMVELLVGNGADLSLQSGAGTPLHWAAGNGHFEAVDTLLGLGAAVDSANEQGITPVIMAAAGGGSGDVVELLVKRGADTGFVLNGNLTLLHICADAGSLLAVRAILETETGRKSAAWRNDGGERAIDMAAASGHEEVVKALFPFSEMDSEGNISSVLEKTVANRESRARTAARRAKEAKMDEGETQEHQVHEADDVPVEDLDLGGLSLEPPNEADAAEAMELKAQANRLYISKEYDAALDLYTKALEKDASAATIWSNRSACFYAMNEFEKALNDARVTKAIDPSWPKAWVRIGLAAQALGRYEDAANAFWSGLKLDTSNKQLKKLLKEAVRQGREANQASKQEQE